ncbi:DUF4232 domain-containing protein [Nocardia macrotermitis]|uniref:DUF4232 domain-containing protein n=1 Tax=Nocardia macrotermitis TaxID=2585198 RepID=A0A7K0D939_9NOCA|nr:DUF4232 domain-containing protein [Nocardia macrotermitis]MQY22061.1 hypothetical protein [Nocardia macrotermitis]
MVSRTTILVTVMACGVLGAVAGCSSTSTGAAATSGSDSGVSTSAAASSASADPTTSAASSSPVSEPGAAVGNSTVPAAITSCAGGQLVVSGQSMGAAMMHRGVQLTFALASGAAPCTLQGYPGVDTGAGGPVVHAARTPTGYMGGPGAGSVVTVRSDKPAHAIVEATAMGPNGTECTMYSTLLVTPPNTTVTRTVEVGINGCELQVHPITE